MNCDRCRVKAMQVVAAAGADSVAVEGEEKDLLVLVGDSVDPADLTTTLRKKVGPASIVKVEEVKEEAKEAAKKAAKESVVWCYPSYSPYHKVVMYDHGIGGASDPGACSIL
ncbi:Heavy-metal-associated domain [Musa troglodytarum]|nr:Heavy-metal-associated domain [Musa troglodytarum]